MQLRKSLLAVVDNARIFGSTVEPRERLTEHRDPDAIDGIGERRLVALAAYDWMHEGGSRDDCAALWLAALETEELIEDDVFVAMAVWPLVIAERDEVDALFEKWIAVAHRRGSAFTRASNDLFSGELALRRGELVEAEEKVGRGYTGAGALGPRGPAAVGRRRSTRASRSSWGGSTTPRGPRRGGHRADPRRRWRGVARGARMRTRPRDG